MVTKIEEISAFFPAYNEEANIEQTLLKADKVLKKTAKKYEIIAVDDGSTDKTPEILKSLKKKISKLKVLSHKENRGYSAALKTGLYNSKYEWIVYTDSDGQHDFSELPKFFEEQKKNNVDLISGYYAYRKVLPHRKAYSFLWNNMINLLFGIRIRDIGCAFKLIRKDIIDTISELESRRGNFICTELLAKAKHHDFKIIQMPITHHSRQGGKSTAVNFRNTLSSLKDLIKLKNKLK